MMPLRPSLSPPGLTLTIGTLALVLLVGCPAPRVEPNPLVDYTERAPQPKQAPDEQHFWNNRDDLFKPPQIQPAQPLSLPTLKRIQLPSGLNVLLVPDRQLPLVDVQLLLKTGSIAEPPDKVGLAEFTAGMLRQGTRRMSADQISATVDAAGAAIGAGSGYELTSVSCRARTRDLDLCLRMVADLVARPTFPAKEMAEIRDRLLSDVKQTRDDPESLANLHLDNMLYGDDHPAGRPMTEASVKAITRKDLVRFHRAHFRPDTAILGVSGDIDPAATERTIRKVWGAWRAATPRRPVTVTPVSDPPAGIRVLLVDKPDLSQSFLALGHAGIRRTHPDRDVVAAMNYVLGGGGFSSRLMEVVRAKGGKTYGVSSHFFRSEVDGAFVVETFTRNAQLVDTLALVRAELARITTEPPTADELRAAKGKLAGGFPIQLKTAAALTVRLMQAQIWGLPDSEVVEYGVRIDRLTREQVARVAREQVRPGHLVAAVVGKAAEVAPLLRRAKIPFEQISYLDPISARQRRALREQEQVKISPAEQQRARRVLARALRVAGGKARLAAIRSLRLEGTATVSSKGQTLKGNYTVQILLPDQMRLALALGPAGMVQVLAGNRAFLQVGPRRKDLPADVVSRWHAVLWREPPLVLLNAIDPAVRCRIAREKALAAKPQLVAVDLFPKGLPPAVLVFERASGHLVQIRHRDRTRQVRVSHLSDHRKVQGVLFPHRVTAMTDGRTQAVTYTRVEVNPKLDRAAITEGR
jgi:zinc protease